MKFATLILHHHLSLRLNYANLIRHLTSRTNKFQTCHQQPVESYRLTHRCHHHLAPSSHVLAQKWTDSLHQPKPRLGIELFLQNVISNRSLHTSSVFFKFQKKKESAVSDEDEETDEDEIDDEPSEDDSEDEDSPSDEEDSDDEGMPKDYKDIHQNLSSLRIDAVLSKGLNISRKKIEDSFFTTNLRINGKVLTKKGKKVKEGDTLDFIKGPAPSSKDETGQEEEMVSLMRVVVKKVFPEKTAKDKTQVVLRRWKSLKLPKSKVKN